MNRSPAFFAFLSIFVASTGLSYPAAAQCASDPSGASELESDTELLVELIGSRLPSQLVSQFGGQAVTRLLSMVGDFSGRNVERGLDEWRAFAKSNAKELGAENIARVGSWLVRLSVLENSPELAEPADRVRFTRAAASRLRYGIAELEAGKQTLGSGKSITTRIVVVLPYERSQPSTLDVAVILTEGQLDGQIARMKSDLDSMSEMGEMESLRLQMAMDRMSKTMSTLSNLLKKVSDTASTITQNIK